MTRHGRMPWRPACRRWAQLPSHASLLVTASLGCTAHCRCDIRAAVTATLKQLCIHPAGSQPLLSWYTAAVTAAGSQPRLRHVSTLSGKQPHTLPAAAAHSLIPPAALAARPQQPRRSGDPGADQPHHHSGRAGAARGLLQSQRDADAASLHSLGCSCALLLWPVRSLPVMLAAALLASYGPMMSVAILLVAQTLRWRCCVAPSCLGWASSASDSSPTSCREWAEPHCSAVAAFFAADCLITCTCIPLGNLHLYTCGHDGKLNQCMLNPAPPQLLCCGGLPCGRCPAHHCQPGMPEAHWGPEQGAVQCPPKKHHDLRLPCAC